MIAASVEMHKKMDREKLNTAQETQNLITRDENVNKRKDYMILDQMNALLEQNKYRLVSLIELFKRK